MIRRSTAAERGAVPVHALAAGLIVAALALFAGGCASVPAPAPAPPAPPPPAAEPPPAPAPAPAVAQPWEIPPDRLGSQRLYRVRYDGPEGEGGLRLTLWLDDADHYDARAADLLGRPLWTLSVRGSGGLWVDHRAEAYCRLDGSLDLDGLPLSPFPLAAMPPLLLGRLPARPAGAAEVVAGADAIEIRDEEGRRWTAELDAGAPVRWTLWGRGVAAGPVLTWVDTGGEAILSDRAAGIQLRWREAVSEPLAGLPAALEPPGGYRAGSCMATAG